MNEKREKKGRKPHPPPSPPHPGVGGIQPGGWRNLARTHIVFDFHKVQRGSGFTVCVCVFLFCSGLFCVV